MSLLGSPQRSTHCGCVAPLFLLCEVTSAAAFGENMEVTALCFLQCKPILISAEEGALTSMAVCPYSFFCGESPLNAPLRGNHECPLLAKPPGRYPLGFTQVTFARNHIILQCPPKSGAGFDALCENVNSFSICKIVAYTFVPCMCVICLPL